jgi:hypothetical protein
MEGRLSRRVVVIGRRVRLGVGVVAGRFPGRHELKCRLGRSGHGQAHMRGLVTSRSCSSPGSQSRSGRHPAGEPRGLLIARVRGPLSGDVTALCGCSWAPRQPPGRCGECRVVSVQGRGLPAEGGDSRAGGREGPGALAAGAREVHPALMQPLLVAPGDLHDTWVLASLAGLETQGHRWLIMVVVGGLDQQPPRLRQ